MRRLLARLGVAGWLLIAPGVEAGLFPVRVSSAPSPFELDIEGKLEFLYAQRVESASRRQLPQGKLRLRLTTDLSKGYRFVADLTGTAGGTPRDPDGPGIYDFAHVLQDISPSLEIGEVYLDYYSRVLDLRLGLQKLSWGKLDALQPNDLVNPEKYYDPVLEEENDRKIGVPALMPTIHIPVPEDAWLPGELRLTLVWQPIYVPYFFPDDDERWYPPLARVPAETESMGFTVRNQSRFRNGHLPARNLDNAVYAARVSGLVGGLDFALYYFDGFDTAPSLDAAARGFVRFDPLSDEAFHVRSEIEIFPLFDRIRAAGGDLAYKVFDATLRVEGAYVFDRLYPRSIRDIVASEEIGTIDELLLLTGREQQVPVTLTPVNISRDAVEWGAGADTFFGETFVLVQVNQTAVLKNDVDLLISDFETRFATTVRRSFLDDRLRAEVIGFYGMQGVFGLAHPRLTYAVNDHLDVRIGYVAIEGHASSFFGQYKQNDEGYVRVRFLF